MRVGYCSPFNPMKSGISDFSEELVPELAKHFEPVLFSPVAMQNAQLAKQYETHKIQELEDQNLRDSLDLVVYHMGNNLPCHEEILNMYEKYPGVLELHDVGLHYLAAERAGKNNDWEGYTELAKYCHGERGSRIVNSFFKNEVGAPWENHSLDMSMNRRIIENATAVIVHSEFAKQMVLGIRDDMPITNIMLHSVRPASIGVDFQKKCRKKLGLSERQVIIGSFGFASEPKRVLQILEALSRYKKQGKDFLYLIVGQAAEQLRLNDRIEGFGLRGCVKVTGFTTLKDFEYYMGACDFCINLRYPTQGESSGSLHRMLGMGKPVVVTNIGTFADYPDDVVIKVRYDMHEIDDILQAICTLADDPIERRKRSENARRFAETYCDVSKNAKRYAEFFTQLLNHTWQPEYEDSIIGRLFELGLTEETYLAHIQKILDEI